MQVRVVSQEKLSSECWLIQIEGPDACKTCEARDTPECGGKSIRETTKNEKGHKVPL